MKIGVFGAGRIGRLVIAETLGAGLSAIFSRQNFSYDGVFCTQNLPDFLAHCEIVIDFSLPEFSKKLVVALHKNPRPLVCGVTGRDVQDLRALSVFSPVFYAQNFSVGVAMMREMAIFAAQNLKNFDIEILEMHHRHKKDAPSGTALLLAEAISSAREKIGEDTEITQHNGARKKNSLQIASQRGGDIAGKHVVGFYADGEFIEIAHTASSPVIFAKGAIVAARNIFAQKNGFFTMADLIKRA